MIYRGQIVCTLRDEHGKEYQAAVEVEGIQTDEKPELANYMALIQAGLIAADEFDRQLQGRLIITNPHGIAGVDIKGGVLKDR